MKMRVIALLTLFAICTCISAAAEASSPFTRFDEWVYSYFSDSGGKYGATVQGYISRDINKEDVSLWILTPGSSQFTEYNDFKVVISPGNIGQQFLPSFDATVYFPTSTTNTNVYFKYGYPDGSNIVFSPTFALCTNNSAMTKPCCDNVAKKGDLSVRVTTPSNEPEKYRISIWTEYPAEKFDANSTAALEEIVDGQYVEVPGAAKIYDSVETGYKMLAALAVKPKNEVSKDLKYVLKYETSNKISYVPDGSGFLVCDLAMDPCPEFCKLFVTTIRPVVIPLVVVPSGGATQPELGEPPVLEEEGEEEGEDEGKEEGEEETAVEEVTDQDASLESGTQEPVIPEKSAGVSGYDWASGCSLSPNAMH